jgi:hypothetical protein
LLILLMGVGRTGGDTSNPDDFLIFDDLPDQIKNLLKEELVKEFGPLTDKIMQDKSEIYGRVISINFILPEGRRLDDSWGTKVVKALGRLGITGINEGDEVRADGQEIAGKVATSMQFTTARGYDDPDVIGFVAMFPASSRTDQD